MVSISETNMCQQNSQRNLNLESWKTFSSQLAVVWKEALHILLKAQEREEKEKKKQRGWNTAAGTKNKDGREKRAFISRALAMPHSCRFMPSSGRIT